MRRVLAILFALLLATMALGAGSATVHPIQSSECAAPPANGTPGDTQDPPGISNPEDPAFLQPIESTLGNGVFQALAGDSGDEHCVFPETTSHGDEGVCLLDPENIESCPDQHDGEDADFPGQG